MMWSGFGKIELQCLERGQNSVNSLQDIVAPSNMHIHP